MLEEMFGQVGDVQITHGFSEPVEVTPEEVEPPVDEVEKLDNILEFSYLPRDIKAYLDRYIIRQTDAKKALAIAVCDHYNNARFVNEQDDDGFSKVDYHKQNILITGPTGVGKTYLVKHVADLIGVPFVKADATKFSETGYVGRDVDDLVRDLVKKADGNVELAEYGVIYIDEIDKLAGAGGSGGRDVSGRGVQTTLLKLMEDTEVSLSNPNDMQSQMSMMMSGGKKGQKDTISTKNILFIVSGAFSGIEKIVDQRQRAGQMGFAAAAQNDKEEESATKHAITEDYIKYGFEAEFIGRLPVRVNCEKLTKNDLANILRYSEGSILRQYERQFAAYGIEISFKPDAIDYIAEVAEKQNTGARALMTALESHLRDFKYEMPGIGVDELVVDQKLLENPAEKLKEYAGRGQEASREEALRELATYLKKFQEQNGVELSFSDDAIHALINKHEEEGQSLRQISRRLFKDYPYGLNLIKSKTGRNSFELTEEAILDSDKYLSDRVLEAYEDERNSEGETGS